MSSEELSKTSPFFSANVIFINELYQKFLQDPQSVDVSWTEFFAANSDEVKSVLADYSGPSWSKRSLKIIGSQEFDISSNSKNEAAKKPIAEKIGKNVELRLANLVSAYRRFGHLAANLDPLGLTSVQKPAELDPENHGIDEIDAGAISRLNAIYCNKVGCEFDYILSNEQKNWLVREAENTLLSDLSKDEKLKILKEIIRTERFEQFLHKRFPGAKRFSVEGGDSSINALEKIIDVAGKSGVKKIIVGMAHRGRLNTLTGVMGKPYHQMIAEFKGIPGIPENITKSGDVKYHMGYSSVREIGGNQVSLSLAFNPSHLEAVNPVVCGRVRAIQDLLNDSSRKQALAVLIHGDAAFAGQGSVAENLVMNGVCGYNTGGVIHIIVNNQIGFTANPSDSRSTLYASDLAKAIDAPIFHVNGDDAESVVKVAAIAARYRQLFKKDVVLDIICYRRYAIMKATSRSTRNR